MAVQSGQGQNGHSGNASGKSFGRGRAAYNQRLRRLGQIFKTQAQVAKNGYLHSAVSLAHKADTQRAYQRKTPIYYGGNRCHKGKIRLRHGILQAGNKDNGRGNFGTPQ